MQRDKGAPVSTPCNICQLVCTGTLDSIVDFPRHTHCSQLLDPLLQIHKSSMSPAVDACSCRLKNDTSMEFESDVVDMYKCYFIILFEHTHSQWYTMFQ